MILIVLEQWKIRDNSWAPTSTQCPEDTVGPEAYGKHAVLVKRPVEFFTVRLKTYL
jgi:hypothetical protein